MVEVGCGIGNFTRFLLDREAVCAVDTDEICIHHTKTRYAGHPNLQITLTGPDRPSFNQLKQFKPDSCVCLNVLEHIEADLDALRSMASLLKSGGRIVLLVPAFPALYGPLDKNLRHYRRYTRRSLLELADAAGLITTKLFYFNALGFFGWWMNAHILRQQVLSAFQIRIYDGWIVPSLATMERFAAPPFGQSLFAVLQKP